VAWELVEQLLPLLVSELQTGLLPEQMQVLLPYTRAMQQLFSDLEAKVG
jgi:hypothetical protein